MTGRLDEPPKSTWQQPGRVTRGGNNAMHMQCSQSRNNFLWGRRRLCIIASHTHYTQPIMPGCCVPTDMRIWEPFAAMPPFCLASIRDKFVTNTKGESTGFNAYEILCNTGAGPTVPSHTTPHTPSIMPGCCAPTSMRVWEPFAAMPPFCMADIGNKLFKNTKGKSARLNTYEILCNRGAGPTAPSHTTPHPCARKRDYTVPIRLG